MKRFLLIAMAVIGMVFQAKADYLVRKYPATSFRSESYVIRETTPERVIVIDKNEPTDVVVRESDDEHHDGSFGVLTRFGYAFCNSKHIGMQGTSDGAFSLGASICYRFGGCYENFGLIAGVDCCVGKLSDFENMSKSVNSALQCWDFRAGFTVTRYFALGGIYGQYNSIRNAEGFVVDGKQNDWGGFATFILPLGKCPIGLNVDFAYTKCTALNISIGVNVMFTVKHKK